MKLDPITYMPNGDLAYSRCFDRKPMVYPGVQITLDPGFFHRHKIRECATKEEGFAFLAQFQSVVDTAGNYQVLHAREYTVNFGGGYRRPGSFDRAGVEILYAIHAENSPERYHVAPRTTTTTVVRSQRRFLD